MHTEGWTPICMWLSIIVIIIGKDMACDGGITLGCLMRLQTPNTRRLPDQPLTLLPTLQSILKDSFAFGERLTAKGGSVKMAGGRKDGTSSTTGNSCCFPMMLLRISQRSISLGEADTAASLWGQPSCTIRCYTPVGTDRQLLEGIPTREAHSYGPLLSFP